MKKFILLFLPAILLFTSCMHFGGKRVKGNGNVQTDERSVNSFNSVEVHGAIDVYVSQGPLQPVRIETDENLLNYIKVEQSGETVVIKNRHGYNIRPTHKVKVYVTSPEYRSLDVSGACNIIGQTKISSDKDLDIEVSGAGDIRMEVNAPKLSADISGSGTVDLKGQTRDFDLGLSGAGKAKCFEMLAENTEVDISGAGSADVYASVKLDAQVSGAGSVKYKGNASNVNQQVSGAGSVKKAD